MARVLYTAAVANIRGKLAGSVFTRNKGGDVIRTKAIPINPKTSYQSAQRGQISDLSKAYQGTLTADQRLAWTNYGKSTNAMSVFGSKLILSGIAAFQKVNRIVLNAGGTEIDTPPINQDVPSIISATLTATSGTPALSIAFTPTPITTPQGLYVWMTPPLSAGISNFNARLRFIDFHTAATSPYNALTKWEARFGTFPATGGQLIGFKVQIVDPTTGAISTGVQGSAIVA